MGVVYIKTDQSLQITTGTGAPTHSAVAGDRYTDTANGNTYQYTTSWQTVSYSAGGLTYFTEAQSTASPNATVNVDSLTAVASTTNADFAIIPKGTGAILAAIPDNGILGGTKRGANAVDFQTFRDTSNQVASGAYSAVLGGYGNKATNSYDFAMGAYCTASGSSSVALGGNCNASGGASLALISQSSASGTFSFAAGRYAGASGTSAVAIGQNNSASGFYSLALGTQSVSSNTTSISIGQNTTADGINSLALGASSNTFGITGRQVFQSSVSATSGDAQKSTLILRMNTTNATAIVLTSNGNTPAIAPNQLTLQNNNSIRFKGTIIGRQSGASNTSAWDIDGIIQRATSAATTTLLVSNVNVVQNTPAWGTPTLTVNTILGCLTVTVIGATSTNIQWTCVIDTTEVIYA